jgi:predicted N-acetyltransferase YhbS
VSNNTFFEIRLRAAGAADAPDILELSAQTFGTSNAPTMSSLLRRAGTWREDKAPTVVARDQMGRFLGFAFSKPNSAGDFDRTDGQVAVLAQVAVVPAARGQGVGSLLVQRSLRTLQMLGYSRASAQLNDDVVKWYSARGWTVLPEGQTKAWIEPHISQDDEWNSDFEPGAFSPILTVFRLPDYPFLAEIQIGDGDPLIEVVFDGAADDDVSTQRGVETLLAHIVTHPERADLFPPALAAVIVSDRSMGTAAARRLLAPIAKRAW